jgi:hypothetical protein
MISRLLSLMVLSMLYLPDSALATPMQRGKDLDKVHFPLEELIKGIVRSIRFAVLEAFSSNF